MNDYQKLNIVKLIHTLIWVGFNLILGYLFYSTITNNINYIFWLGISLIFLEVVLLIMLKWTCPLTFIARKYSDSTKDNFDIFLPNWLAKHNKLIYSILFAILVLIYIFNILIK